jgi:hypothetical protein
VDLREARGCAAAVPLAGCASVGRAARQAFPISTMPTDTLSASDGFAIAMIAMILLSFGTVGVLVICMLRNAARRDPHVDQLLEEIEESERREKLPAPPAEDPVEKQPWEKDTDWWKS